MQTQSKYCKEIPCLNAVYVFVPWFVPWFVLIKCVQICAIYAKNAIEWRCQFKCLYSGTFVVNFFRIMCCVLECHNFGMVSKIPFSYSNNFMSECQAHTNNRKSLRMSVCSGFVCISRCCRYCCCGFDSVGFALIICANSLVHNNHQARQHHIVMYSCILFYFMYKFWNEAI